jgi:arginine-tRNA-protein transferase
LSFLNGAGWSGRPEEAQQAVTAPVRFPRFFVTSPAPCPYLEGKSERKVFTELKGRMPTT